MYDSQLALIRTVDVLELVIHPCLQSAMKTNVQQHLIVAEYGE